MLGVLAQSDYLFGDGDFAEGPGSLRQIYTIRSALSGRSVTAAYCLLSRRAQTDYEYLLRGLVASCAELGRALTPRHANLYFDPAEVAAVRDVIGAAVQIATRYYICRSRSGGGFRERAFRFPTRKMKWRI